MPEVRYRRADEVVWRQAHGNVYIQPPGSRDVVVLAGTGTDVWHAFAAPKTIDEVARDLTVGHESPTEVVARDIASAVADLVERRVLAEA